MTWETVGNKTETVTTDKTASDTTFLYKGIGLQFLDAKECCLISDLFVQFNCNNTAVQ